VNFDNTDTTSQILRATNFGFSAEVPAGSTIDGIEVGVERLVSGLPPPPADEVMDLLVRLRTGSGQAGDDKADIVTAWTSTDTEIIYGGSGDDWNAGLDDGDVRSTDFGLDFRAQRNDIGDKPISQVDAIRMRVHYTPPPVSPGMFLVF
jgi:hypothetical protein